MDAIEVRFSAMNVAIREVARRYLDGRTLTEGLLNHIEVAVGLRRRQPESR